jgi:hypothetical protein
MHSFPGPFLPNLRGSQRAGPLGSASARLLLRLQPPGNLIERLIRSSSSFFSAAQKGATDPGLTVHEWGTFTSIAGNDGQAMDWLPLTGSTDLPSFVEHFRNVNFKGGLRGTVRTETPVLYFYSQGETTVSVKVSFAKGLITEWYPHTSAVASLDPRRDISLHEKRTQGSITRDSVHIEPSGPSDFPREEQENHYYAARETSSAPVHVNAPRGEQRENFFSTVVSPLFPPLCQPAWRLMAACFSAIICKTKFLP